MKLSITADYGRPSAPVALEIARKTARRIAIPGYKRGTLAGRITTAAGRITSLRAGGWSGIPTGSFRLPDGVGLLALLQRPQQ